MSIERRIPNWDITIHKNDLSNEDKKLFDNAYLRNYLQKVFKPNSEIYFIRHDKDLEEDGTLKEEHIHLAIKLNHNQGKTFSRMKMIFPNSHLEEAQEFTNVVLYLTHESKTAIEQNKIKYDRDLVVNVNDTDISKYYDKPLVEVFDFDKIEEYIIDRGFRTIVDFGRAFGYNVISSKWKIIKEIEQELLLQQRIEQEESKRTNMTNFYKDLNNYINEQDKQREVEEND